MITPVLSVGWISCAVMPSPEEVIGPEASSVTSDTGIWRSHRRGSGRSPRPDEFADRPGHSQGGLLILKLRPFVGFKIMIGTDWVYKTFTNVQSCQRLRGVKALMGLPEGAAASTDACCAQAIVRPGDWRRL
jgi:hypothetical protein